MKVKVNPHIITRVTTGLLAFAVLSGVFTACKTGKGATADKEPKGKEKITEKQRLDAEFLFFNASKESILGNYDEAARLYNQSIQINPYNGAAYYELGRIAFDKKDYENAVILGKTAVSLDKKNVWYKLLYGQSLQGVGKYDEAIKIYEQLVKDNPESIEYAFELADAYLRANRPDDAIKALDKVENLTGINPDIIEQKQRLYLQMGQIEKAANEIQKLIDLSPADPTYYMVLADMYLANRMPDKAFEVYERILKIDPTNGPVHYSLSEYYRGKGDKAKSFDELKLAFGSPDVDIDTKVQVLLSYYNISEFNTELKGQAFELAELMVKAHSDDAKAYSMYGDFLYRDKRYAEARDNFLKVIDLDDSKYIVWSQLIACEERLSDYQGVYTHSTKALELFPTQPELYLYKGMSASVLKKNKEAIETLTDGAALIYNNRPLEIQFLTLLGDAYNEAKDYKKSDEYYDKVLEMEPQNTGVLNNYSYYLSVRKDKLTKAKEMARTVNTIEPNNPTYQDTYAWVLYVTGDFKGAREWLEKALSNGGDKNGTILEHYGDVLFKLGDTDAAMVNWKKAKEKGETSDLLDKKIADKKLIE